MSESDRSDRDEVYESTTTETRSAGSGKWVSAVVAVLGLWLVVQPFLFELTAANFWNDVVVGLVLVVLGGYNYYRRSDVHRGSVSVGVFVALLGLWLVVAPFVFGPDAGAVDTSAVGFWNDVVVGLLVAILGVYSAYEARRGAAGAARA